MAVQLAEIGVILLMFGVGLHFHLKELPAVRGVAIPGALVEILVATLLAAAVTRIFNWDWTADVVFGLAISVASTVVLVRVLADNRDLHTRTGHIAVGWLVVEDLFTVVVLLLLPALFGAGQAGAAQVPWVLGLAAVKIAILVAFTVLVGSRVIPWLLEKVAATRSRELFTLTVLVVALGIAVGSAKVFGVSMALGAFLAGMVVGRSEFSLRAASEALPMRDAFAVLFFVSVGLLFNPHHLMEEPWLMAATLGIIIIGKPLTALCIVMLLRYPFRIALSVAVALAQIGEFSFMLALLGNQLGILPSTAMNTLVAAAILSITVNPVLYRLIDRIEGRAARWPRLWAWLNVLVPARKPATSRRSRPRDPSHQAIVVGYGPVGQTVTRLLRENEIEPTVIELNLDTVRRLQAEGISAVYGDVNHADTLKAAGIDCSGNLILSMSGIRGSEEAIRLARELNPSIRIFVHSQYVGEHLTLRQAGADGIFAAEAEVALAMTVAILTQLGTTAEQFDRERERVHVSLFGRRSAADRDKGSNGSGRSRPARRRWHRRDAIKPRESNHPSLETSMANQPSQGKDQE